MNKWIRRSLILLGSALVIYTAFGFLAVPALIRHQALPRAEQYIETSISVGSIRFNPFLLRLRIDDFALHDHHGAALVGFNRLEVDLEAISLIRDGWHLKYLLLDTPHIAVHIDSEGVLNASRIIPPETGDWDSPEPVGVQEQTELHLPLIYIGRLEVLEGNLSFRDDSVDPGFKFAIDSLSFAVDGFNTDPQWNNRHRFEAVTALGERLLWEGDFAFDPLSSEGRLEISGFSPASYTPYLKRGQPFHASAEDLNLAFDYYFAPLRQDFRVEAVNLELDGIRVHSHGWGEQALLDRQHFRLSDGRLDLYAGQAACGEIFISSGVIRVERNADGALNWLSLLGDEEATPTPTETEVETVADTTEHGDDLIGSLAAAHAQLLALPTLEWDILVERIRIQDQSIEIEDSKPSSPSRIEISGINVEIDNLSTREDARFEMDFRAQLQTDTVITLNGHGSVQPLTSFFDFHLDALPLNLANPYLEDFSSLRIASGSLNSAGWLNLITDDDGMPVIETTFMVAANDLGCALADDPKPWLSWHSLEVNGIEAGFPKNEATIAEIRINQPAINLSRSSADGIDPISKLIAEAGAMAPEPVESESESAAEPIQLSLKRLAIRDGSVRFSDTLTAEAFTTNLDALNVTVTDFTWQPLGPFAVEADGNIDGTGRLQVDGSLNLAGEQPDGSIKIAVRALPLTPMSPYALHYVGYAIDGGRLGLQLDYHAEAGSLRGDNRMNIQNIRLGDRSTTPPVINAPIRPAISLLQDRNGQIQFQVPVSGSLDDPSFSIGPAVQQAITGIIARAATAPFSMIGSLFGGGSLDLESIYFEPGRSILADGEEAKTDVLARALQERPQLSLGIVGLVDGEQDPLAIARRNLEIKLAEHTTAESGDRSAILRSLYQAIHESDAEIPVVLPSTDESKVSQAKPEAAEAIVEAEAAKAGDTDTGIVETAATADTAPAAKTTEVDSRRHPQTTTVTLGRHGPHRARLLSGEREAPVEPRAVKPEPAVAVAAPKKAKKEAEDVATDRVAETDESTVEADDDWFEQQLITAFMPPAETLAELAAERAKAIRNELMRHGEINPDHLTIVTEGPIEAPRPKARLVLDAGS